MKIYTFNGRLFFERAKGQHFKNKNFNNEDWFIYEFFFFSIYFKKQLWGLVEDFYYDGHTFKSFAILGVVFCKGYSYDSRRAVEWSAEELIDPWYEEPANG